MLWRLACWRSPFRCAAWRDCVNTVCPYDQPIDVGLGAQLFRHLLALPLAYFEARRVGDTVARVRELEQIRQFLTSNSVTVVLWCLPSFFGRDVDL